MSGVVLDPTSVFSDSLKKLDPTSVYSISLFKNTGRAHFLQVWVRWMRLPKHTQHGGGDSAAATLYPDLRRSLLHE